MILLPAALLQQTAVSFALGGSDFIMPSIHGADNRLDYFEAEQRMKTLSESTAALFKDSEIPQDAAGGGYRLKPLSLKDKYNLRDGQRFGGQTIGAFCSAALVGDDMVLTSGHCLKPDPRGAPCERVKFVFGYAMTREGDAPVSFAEENVYSCKEIISQRVQDDISNFTCAGGSCSHRALAGFGPDYALVRLDHKVKGRTPLAVSRTRITAGTQVTAIGYPSGLPVKVAGGSEVRSVAANSGYFVTDLDTFGGNSGGPVFNTATYKIEGVLARGDADYVYGSGTPVEDPKNPYLQQPGETRVYAQDGGKGEEVTLSAVFEKLIPKTAMERSLDSRVPDTAPQRQPAVQNVHIPGATRGSLQLPPASAPAPMEQ